MKYMIEYSIRTSGLSHDQNLANQDAKPDFDLVQPRGVGGCEVEMDVLVIGEELLDATRLVGREVVQNDADLFASRLARHDLAEEGNELFAAVPRHGLGDDLAGARVESGVEGERPMAVVLEAMAFQAPWPSARM